MESLRKGLEGQGKTVADYCKETKQTEAQIPANITLMLQWNAYAAQKVTPADLKKYYADFKDFFDKTTVRAATSSSASRRTRRPRIVTPAGRSSWTCVRRLSPARSPSPKRQ